ncbi:hypothetical protein BU15DRAFT_64895 [Melanogaster broomeanus]|nr:hypothetical protein BU15DRAFT_64895 [Melanogaster broomeanus]
MPSWGRFRAASCRLVSRQCQMHGWGQKHMGRVRNRQVGSREGADECRGWAKHALSISAWEQRNKMAKLHISLTIPDLLLMCVMHLETAHEWFKHLADRFEMKTSDVSQREASCNPRRPRGCSQAARVRSDHKPEIAKVTEPCDSTHREWKCDVRSRGRVEKRDRRGKRATGWTGEQEAAVRELGEEAVDATTRSISLAVMLSSQDDNSRDVGVPCTCITLREPQSTRPAASDTAADAVTPNTTSAEPPEPVGMSHELQNELHKSMGSYPGSRGKNDDSRGPGAHCMCITAESPQTASPTASEVAADAANPNTTSAGPTGPVGASHKPWDELQSEAGRDIDKEVEREGEQGERPKGRASEKVATAKGPGEEAMDQGADSVSLAAPASSPVDATTTLPSVLLEGERENQVTSGSMGVHDDTADVQGDALRHTSDTRTGQ